MAATVFLLKFKINLFKSLTGSFQQGRSKVSAFTCLLKKLRSVPKFPLPDFRFYHWDSWN